MTTTKNTIEPGYDHGADPAVRKVIEILESHFEDMDDGETPFGCFGQTETAGNVVTISPDPDPANHEHDDDEDPDELNTAPTTPVVRITVERIA